MTIAETTKIITDLQAMPPLSCIKVESDERGWWWLYYWTGRETMVCVGPTLPEALHVLACILYKRFGAEV